MPPYSGPCGPRTSASFEEREMGNRQCLASQEKASPVGIKDVYREGQRFEQGGPLESENIILLREDSFSGKAVDFGCGLPLSYDACLEPCVENSKIVPDLVGRNAGID